MTSERSMTNALSYDGAPNRCSHTAAIQRAGPAVGSVARCFVFTALLLIPLFAGCAVGPDYHRPAALGASVLPAAFGVPAITNAGDWKTAEPSAHLPRGVWWEIYADPELNRLERLAVTNNQQIATALANLEQASAAAKIVRADFFPQLNTSPSASRQRTSANASPTGAAAGTSRTFNLLNVSADASWEIDLWGRIRRQVEGARARVTASADDLESARLSVQAEVALDYFTLRALDAQSELLTRTSVAYQRALELTQNRHLGGIASELDVAQAETQLESAKAQIPAVDLQRAQLRHALAVLCGQLATTFALTPNTAVSTNLPAVPLSVPSEWLESRPDISAAERNMAAANADIGAAKAAFYPRVLLNGAGGFASISAGTLFDWPSRLWAFGPTLQLPLLTGGRNRAQLASARASYDGTVATYRQTVLTAFQDVEDQLAAQSLLADQFDEENAALASAQRTLDISNNRYKAGVEQYLDVIAAQTTTLAHEQSVIQLNGQRFAASVSLIKSLGAGWKEPSTYQYRRELSQAAQILRTAAVCGAPAAARRYFQVRRAAAGSSTTAAVRFGCGYAALRRIADLQSASHRNGPTPDSGPTLCRI
jgi:NodT family efflux transporter outer membrane factor (OMF) lipoprotein